MPECPLNHIAAHRQQYRHKPRQRTIPASKKVQKSKMSEKKCIFANSTSRGQPPQPRWDPCGYGVIGSRARLRIWFFTEWGFESPYPHLSPPKSTAPAALFLFPASRRQPHRGGGNQVHPNFARPTPFPSHLNPTSTNRVGELNPPAEPAQGSTTEAAATPHSARPLPKSTATRPPMLSGAKKRTPPKRPAQ